MRHIRYYSILESCMQPSGAYAKTQATYPEEAPARVAFTRALFQGPGRGITWARTLTLQVATWEQGTYQREVLLERRLP